MIKARIILTIFSIICWNKAEGCGFPGAPSHATVTFSSEDIGPGTVATHSCERGFELLGPARRICSENGTWIPVGIPFCVLNVATGKAPMQSSVESKGIPQKAVDGSTSTFYNPGTCTQTKSESKPWWYVNLLEPYMVQLVRVDFGKSCCDDNSPAKIVVRVGNNRPDLRSNPICNQFTGYIEEGRPLFLPCNPPMPGTFVSVTLEEPASQKMSICETFVYTDQALPIERCPSFRDQPLGSTATYNGKCYIFYNNQVKNFENAKRFCEQRGGSLVDETSPALQGFLSWELWRRHRSDPNAKYWMGAIRSEEKQDMWKWLNGDEVSVSFWNKPGGKNNCSRFDGAKGWLWSDTRCTESINFICQHKPRTCGKPEQPTNSTLLARNYNVGTTVEYRCAPGHLLVGPQQRTCMSNGFFGEFPPKCKYLECPTPYPVTNGEYRLINGTMTYKSVVQYRCIDGYRLRGRAHLNCDVNKKWDGPPPTCEPIYCRKPPSLRNGSFKMSRNTSIAGTTVEYSCKDGYNLVGKPKIMCLSSGTWDTNPPFCKEQERKSTTQVPKIRPPIRRPATLPPFRETTRRQPSVNEPEVIVTPKPTRRTYRPTARPKPTRRDPSEYVTKRTRVPRPTQLPDLISEGSKEVPIVTRYPSAKENEIPDGNNAKNDVKLRSNLPESSLGEISSRNKKTTKLNLGGIIALGVFGGFVFLAAIITIIVILVRRNRNKKRGKGSLDNTTIITYDSSSDNSANGGLNKYYRKAWENLRYDNKTFLHDQEHDKPRLHATLSRLDHGPPSHHHHHHGQRRPGVYSPSEGYREANEMVVSDVAALYSRPDRRTSKQHHDGKGYHSHGHSHKKSLSRDSVHHLDDAEIQSWYNKQLGSQSRRSAF